MSKTQFPKLIFTIYLLSLTALLGGCLYYDEMPNHSSTAEISFIPTQTRTFVVGAGDSMFIDSNNRLFAWGLNRDGQLGNGSTVSSYTPIHVMNNVLSVHSRGDHTVAIKTDGSLWTWGNNEFGQLGDGTTTNSHRPVRIIDNVIYAYAGVGHTMAITKDNSLWIWGGNNLGHFVPGAETPQLVPVHVMDDVVAISGLNTIIMAVQSDGTLWGWGRIRPIENTQFARP